MSADRAGGHGGTTGFVLIDKEAGWTSHDVVARCRRIFGQRRVGHAGTLDPDATGLLIVGLGRATRLLRYMKDLPKAYEGEMVLGTATSTLDASGEVTGQWDMSAVAPGEAREAASRLTGEIMQIPPMVSAVKVGGQRLYELARRGEEVDRAPRRVVVDRFDVVPSPSGEEGIYRFEVDCSTGTYVRVLVADAGNLLGGGAHVRTLRRTRVGSFGVDEARKIDEVAPGHVLAPVQALRDMAQVEIGPEVKHQVEHGLAIDRVAIGATGAGPWALVEPAGRLLAVYEATETDRLVAAVVLAEPKARR
jgi:tRNA pseudouridine55 synthase